MLWAGLSQPSQCTPQPALVVSQGAWGVSVPHRVLVSPCFIKSDRQPSKHTDVYILFPLFDVKDSRNYFSTVSNCKLDKIDEIIVFRHWTVGSLSVIMREGRQMRWALGFAGLIFRASFRPHWRAGELKEPNTPTELKRIKSKFEDTKMARIYKAKYWKEECFPEKKLWRSLEESSWISGWVLICMQMRENSPRLGRVARTIPREHTVLEGVQDLSKIERSHNILFKVLRRLMLPWWN